MKAPLDDNSPMPFGAHKGTPMGQVPGRYLWFIYDTGKTTPEVKAYIEDNLDIIKKEAGVR